VIGVPNLINGVIALCCPRFWFDTLKVGALGGYNDHLVRDVGEAFIAVSVLAILAAFFLDRHVVMAAATTWTVFSLPHFINHIIERDKLDMGNYLASILATGYPVVLALVTLRKSRNLSAQEASS
jgi:hypothetical protein